MAEFFGKPPFSSNYDFLPDIESIVNELIDRRLFPQTTTTTGRSLKFTDTSSFSVCLVTSGTVTTVANTLTETTLASFVIPADALHVGLVIKMTAWGHYSSNNGPVVTITAAGNVTAWDSMSNNPAAATVVPWHMTEYGIIRTLGSSGTIQTMLLGEVNNVNKSAIVDTTQTINTTTSLTVAVTAEWDTAAAANTITIRGFIVELIG